MGKFAVLKPGERAAIFQAADAEAAPVEEPSAHKLEGASAASARFKTAPGDGSAAWMPDGAVAAFADTAAVPVEGFTVLDNAVEETAASATGGAALVCHVEHAVMACEEMWVELYDKSHGCTLLPTAPNLRAVYIKAVQCDTSDMPIASKVLHLGIVSSESKKKTKMSRSSSSFRAAETLKQRQHNVQRARCLPL